MWDLIVSVPDHCLSFYFLYLTWVVDESFKAYFQQAHGIDRPHNSPLTNHCVTDDPFSSFFFSFLFFFLFFFLLLLLLLKLRCQADQHAPPP